MENKYPIFVPTKGRSESLMTIDIFQSAGVDFKAVVEPQEYDQYASVVDSESLLVLPHSDKGLVVTRNWIWDYASDLGVKRFWTFDDNIKRIFRFNKNLKTPVSGTGLISCLRAMEDFVDRYNNVVVAGCHYFMFVKRKNKVPPFYTNRRVYSNMLIQTNAKDRRGKPFRNEGFYNDDTDLCLRILKDGKCTILFNAFLIEKSVTMTVSGGMTPHYKDDGRWKMAEELRRKHPDVVKVVRKWGRWQHQVDYRPFKRNRLIKRSDVEIKDGVNNYGMELVTRKKAELSNG